MPRDPAASAIEAFRQATTCAPELRDANWAAVQARVRGDTHDAGSERVELPRGRSSARAWVIAGVALAAAAAAVWWGARGWSGARVVADRDVADQAFDASQPVVAAGRAQPIPATPPESPRTGPGAEAVASPAIAPRQRPQIDAPTIAPAPIVPSSVGAPSDDPADDPLGREAQLIASGRAALGSGALDDAAAASDRHTREFPDGTMGPERMALAVRLQCARRDLPAARAAAASYLRAHPGSALARRLAATPCTADENP
jgi:hypothetical protein